jgi:hypothetical protein
LRNYGAAETVVVSVKFFGVDTHLRKWFSENGLSDYYEPFVDRGINQIKARGGVVGRGARHIPGFGVYVSGS